MRCNSILPLIKATEDKLYKNFNFKINIDGLNDLFKEIDKVLEIDNDNLYRINKEILIWYSYISEIHALIEIYIDRFKNTLDVYSYLDALSKEDINEFSLIAPKYKINTRDTVAAVIELNQRKEEMNIFIKNLKGLNKVLLSYKNFLKSHYFKTNRLMIQNENKLKLSSF